MPTVTKSYRYQLPQKAVKGDCPECGPKYRRTLSRYIDTRTGEALPDVYGRCDRESNCGYHLSPYQKSPAGLSYADEVYQQSKENQSSSQFMNRRESWANKANPNQVAIVSPRIVHSIPDEVVKPSVGHYERNQFARLLERYCGGIIASELLNRFQIGTSRHWNNEGACVFWLIDEQGRKRGGQIKLFDDTFHTVKYVDKDGRRRTRTSWVHAVLSYQYNKEKQSYPDWLTAYIEQGEFAPCLFGLQQLTTEDIAKPIAIVEAPKTAVLCTPRFPQFIWLAAIGRSYLNAERLEPLRGRKIVLFPDLAASGKDYLYWKAKAGELRQQGFNVIVSDYLEKVATDEQREQGLDLADFLLQSNPPILKIVPDEILDVEPCDTYPADWDTPAKSQPAPVWIPTARIAFPSAPLAFDAIDQLRRIRWAVIPIDADEPTYIPPVLVDSPNRTEYARRLGIQPDQLPLYQLHSQPTKP